GRFVWLSAPPLPLRYPSGLRLSGAQVSITVRMDPAVRRAIAATGQDAWASIRYTDAIFDETTSTWISGAEVAEIDFTAFTSRKKSERVPGRLMVPRIPGLNSHKHQGQPKIGRASCRERV